MNIDIVKKIYMKARGINQMGDNFMEPWEFEYAKLIILECSNIADDPDIDILRVGKEIKDYFELNE